MFLYGQSMLRICKRQVAVWMYLYKKNSRMKIIPIIQCAAMLGCIADSAFAKEAGRPDGTVRPNFIVIFVDDLGYNDLGLRNSSFNTPNIDRLASQSVNFVNAYVPSPTSSPSRAALLTGKYPVKQGITRHINSRNEDPFGTGEYEMLATDPGHIPNRRFLPKSETTIADVLNSAGYRTGAVDYITKPFNPHILLMKIGNILAQYYLSKENLASETAAHDRGNVPVRNKDEAFINKAREIIYSKMSDEEFSVAALSNEMGISRVHLTREFQRIIGKSPSAFIKGIRLNHARHLLASGNYSIKEVIWEIGIRSHSGFTKAYKEEFGYLPSQTRDSENMSNNTDN